eukprot:767064-Hanusia_phi.AAC.7
MGGRMVWSLDITFDNLVDPLQVEATVRQRMSAGRGECQRGARARAQGKAQGQGGGGGGGRGGGGRGRGQGG